MMTYKDILKSDYFKECYELVEELKKDFPVNHGFIHIDHVLENAKSLAKLFELSEIETNLLLIACCLHDIGYIKGRSEHAKNGGILAREYLTKNSDLNSSDIDVICNAIASHGGDNLEDYRNKVSLCLIFADKLDYIASRYKEVEETKLYRTIAKTELVKENGVYKLNIYSTMEDFEDRLKSASFHIHKKLMGILENFMQVYNVKVELCYKQI